MKFFSVPCFNDSTFTPVGVSSPYQWQFFAIPIEPWPTKFSWRCMDVPAIYGGIVQWIRDGTAAPDALLHVHAGLAVLLIARLVTRRSLATFVPFAVVCCAELINEVLDRIHHGSWRWSDTSLDILNTLFWPFVLMIGLRLRSAREAVKRQPQE